MDIRVKAQDKERAVQYFESLSSKYNNSVERGVLRFLRNRERNAILRMANLDDRSKKNLIDVGCGGGFYALSGKKAGLRVCAVDISQGMIENLRSHVDEAYVTDLESLALKSRFDIVVCSGVLEFVLDPETAFRNLAKLVAPQGRLVIQAPRRGLAGWIYRFEKSLINIQVNLFSRSWFEKQGRLYHLHVTGYEKPLPTNQVILLEHERPQVKA